MRLRLIALILIWGVLPIFLSIKRGGERGASAFDVRYVSSRLAPGRMDPVVDLVGDDEKAGRYIGTAFAITRAGVWVTARHVAEGCSTMSIEPRRRSVRVRQALLMRAGDLAVLVTDDSRNAGIDPLVERFPGIARPRGLAFAVGYPQGKRGSLVAQFLGRVGVRQATTTPGIGAVWAVKRYPRIANSHVIGGMSGGPVFNARGELEGIIVGSSTRRNRVTTIDRAYIAEAIANLARPEIPARPVDGVALGQDFEREARAMQDEGVVALVNCRRDRRAGGSRRGIPRRIY